MLNLYDSFDCNCIGSARNIIWIGPTGVGKTGLATAFLMQAINRGYNGRFILFPELIEILYQSMTNKRSGCFYIKDKGAKKVVLCEFAIDAISYFVIHRNCLAVSTSGANPSPYWLAHFINHGFEIFCAFDSDETGERTANRMRELYPMVKRLRPEKHDWNDVLKSKTL